MAANNPNNIYTVDVHLEDTDAGGRVYYPNYLKFIERARVNYFKNLGFDHHQMINTSQNMFVVHHCAIDYLQGSFLGDTLKVITTIEKIGGASITLAQNIYKQDVLICKAIVRLVMITQSGKATKLDDTLLEKLKSC